MLKTPQPASGSTAYWCTHAAARNIGIPYTSALLYWPSCAHPQDRTGYRLEVATVRKLETESDAFAFGDKLIEKWYGTVEKGSDKGILLVVTTNKDGALTGGPKFLKVTFPSRSQGQAVLSARPGPSIRRMPEEVQPWLQSSHARTSAVSIFMQAVGLPAG